MDNGRTCMVSDCDYPVECRGWCSAHYQRWRKTGEDPGARPLRRHSQDGTCTVEGCGRPHAALGFCMTHHRRFKKDGDPGSADIQPRIPGRICSVAGCDRPSHSGGHCTKHAQRVLRWGSPDVVVTRAAWSGDDVGYFGLHTRIKAERGRAAEYPCDRCGVTPAAEWAYTLPDPDERVSATGRAFSLDTAKYAPLCVPCHRAFDAASKPKRACAVDGCARKYKARGLCALHYQHLLRGERRASTGGDRGV